MSNTTHEKPVRDRQLADAIDAAMTMAADAEAGSDRTEAFTFALSLALGCTELSVADRAGLAGALVVVEAGSKFAAEDLHPHVRGFINAYKGNLLTYSDWCLKPAGPKGEGQ